MEKDFVLVPVRSADMAVGKPLPWSVYDAAGNFLLVKGFTLESQSQLDMLKGNGYVRDFSSKVANGASPVAHARRKQPSGDSEAEAGATVETITRMDRVKWQVGESLELQPLEAPAIRYSVRLVGFAKGQSVIVTAPTVDGKLAFIREGQAFVARSFFGKRAYAFSTSVIKVVHTPYSYLHLAYPAQVRLATVRRGARAKVNDIASIALGEQERAGAAVLVDISTGGASAVASCTLGEAGERGRLIVRVNVADDEHYLTLNVSLRSVTATENGDGYRHGFEFHDLTLHDRLVLTAYVNHILAEAGI